MMNLHDQHLRLVDLKLAFARLAQVLIGTESAKRQAVSRAPQALRARGPEGAAALLEGAPTDAPYRR